jgi:hypothetical protein
MAKGLAVGLNRGHVVTKIEKPSRIQEKKRKHSFPYINESHI